MRLREAAGCINNSSEVLVFVAYASGEQGGYYLSVSRPQAKEIIADAKAKGIEEIDVTSDAGGRCRIGDEHVVEDDDPQESSAGEPVCSQCGGDWTHDHECDT